MSIHRLPPCHPHRFRLPESLRIFLEVNGVRSMTVSAPTALKDFFEAQWTSHLERHYANPVRLAQAIHYALAGDGKRVRAVLAMLVAEHFGRNPRVALSAATAVEMIHSYSLAHDDLPCMDNDDWRRGKPSLHKAFDEASALLAGDAILTDAFRVLTDGDFFADAMLVNGDARAKQVMLLAKAAGSKGMVLGQDRDLWWTGREGILESALNEIHELKTGALIGAACAMGAAAADASKAQVNAFETFGRLIGIAFQAIDDTLDDSYATGKTAGKDLAQGKLTYLRFHSTQEVIAQALALSTRAATLVGLKHGSPLQVFIDGLVFRHK